MQELILAAPDVAGSLEGLIPLVTRTVDAPATKRDYARELNAFFAWYREIRAAGFTRQTVYAYRERMQEAERGAVSINKALSAIRKLAGEAADCGMLDAGTAMRITKIPNVERLGERMGNWLSKEQLRRVLTAELPGTPNRVLRDRTALWIMSTCGLRRAEVAALRMSHLQMREGRPIFIDLIGKKKRMRSVPVHTLAYDMILAWVARVGTAEPASFLLRAVDLHDRIKSEPVCTESLREMCERHGETLGITFRPHDLRRTFATLARKGGADYEEIRQALGHASVTTTARYLDKALILENAAADRITF